jgi:hypothetical protein
VERPAFAALWPVFDDWRKRVTDAPGNVPAVFYIFTFADETAMANRICCCNWWRHYCAASKVGLAGTDR